MDANSRLKDNVSPYIGKYGVHSRADEGGNLIFEIMKDNDLTAINTRYQQNGNRLQLNKNQNGKSKFVKRSKLRGKKGEERAESRTIMQHLCLEGNMKVPPLAKLTTF